MQNLLAPRVIGIVENAAASPIAALQSRIAILETRIQDRDLELAALRRDFERLQSSERAGRDRSQELAASLGYLHEGIGILLDRIEELERKQN